MTDGREDLVEFLSKYCELIELQLSSVRFTMAETVEKIMEGARTLNANTMEAQKRVERALEEKYLEPDDQAKMIYSDIDESTVRLMEQVNPDDMPAVSPGLSDNQQPRINAADLLRRINACDDAFARDMLNLKELDDNLRSVMLGMVGALSSEDVIAQKLNHIIMALKVLQIGLSYTLIDFDGRSNKEEIQKMISDVQKYTIQQFVSQDEKNQYYQIFKIKKTSA